MDSWCLAEGSISDFSERMKFLTVWLWLMAVIWPAVSEESRYFWIQVIDENGRGVPFS
jgi:hypothetical protein